MVDQVHLEDVLARFQRGRRVREHLRTFSQWCRAGFDQATTSTEDLHGTDTTRSPCAQQGLETEIRNFDTGEAGGLENLGSGRNGHVLAVDLARYHLLLRGRDHSWGFYPHPARRQDASSQ